ncbi:NAD(P)/FAD-dependent oxidoreductase [Kutzneria sp. NPDC051319]|uniref:flavin-containing monooxygenase n=1 Tax=Kutzneria sp. NPDC051319 TaxID=3155047 RepID=UPI0034493C08
MRVIVIGGGLSGVAAAVRLRREGHEFLVLERGEQVGGTWRDNTYPGAACDVPSHLYSFSFAPNPAWTRSFSRQGEIQDYIVDVVRRHRLRDNHVFGCEVLSTRWSDADSRWELETTKGRFTADIVVAAFGALCEPARPDIPGIEDFDGTVFHSARWDHDADLSGKRVAVIGSGASAIQIVPGIADRVGQLEVYQRTPPWILPRMDRRYTAVERFACRRVPFYQRLMRTAIYWAREAQVVGLAKNPLLMLPMELAARAKLRMQVRDRALRRKFTPGYRLGCKRILISNDYYPTFAKRHVRLVTEGIQQIKANALVTADGEVHEADVIVLATGFQIADSPSHRRIFGRDGRSLGDVFDQVGRECYKGTTIAGFPNMFFMVGPSTGLGHSSMIYMIEAQVNYLADALATMRRARIRTVEVRRPAQEAFARMLQRRMAGSVWDRGGCASWYRDKHGRNTTLWPGFSFEFARLTRQFDLDAYAISTEDAP